MITEEIIQGLLMQYLLGELNHIFTIPNSNQFFGWEADVISCTKSGLTHEFEIKISKADYIRDKKKVHKHKILSNGLIRYHPTPSYFWYVTYGFDIEPPAHAGWISVFLDTKGTWRIAIQKQAPRLHNIKITDKQKLSIITKMSWRLAKYIKCQHKEPA